MDTTRTIRFEPIGFVRNGVDETPRTPDWQLETVSELVITQEWAPALDGLEEFSHVIVLFFFHRVSEPVLLKVHPMHRLELPEIGLFASRTPNRPNRIGLSVVPLLGRKANILTVKGLDALNGTPLLDIKPYLPGGDLVLEATGPSWTRKRQK